MKEFSNQLIDTSQLPSIDEVSFLSLDINYRKVVLINASLISALIIGCSSVFYWWDFQVEKEINIRFVRGVFLLVGIVLALILWVMSLLGVSRKTYAFREHDVIYRSGVILKSEIVIPYNRVQHVALHEGMISRLFQLAALEFFTAGGVNGDLKIPGIPKEQANRIKQFIVDKVHTIALDDAQPVEEPMSENRGDQHDISVLDGEL